MNRKKIVIFLCFAFFVLSFQLHKPVMNLFKNFRSGLHICRISSVWLKNAVITPDITLVGRAKMADGLGRILVEALDQLSDKYNVSVISYDNDLAGVPKNLHKKIKYQTNQQGRVVIYFDPIWLSTYRFEKKFDLENLFEEPKRKDQIRVAYSMYEASMIPQQWVIKINTYFDHVLVPDEYLKSVYENSGVTVPVHVVPLGTNLDPYLKSPIKSSRNEVFTFGNLSAAIHRKNLETVIKAFKQAFGGYPGVQLKINCRNGYQDYIQSLYAEIGEFLNKNIFFEVGELSEDRYLGLMKSFDCLVQISKGEGFSIQPREAMALGIPCICSNNTSQITLCKSEAVVNVETPVVEPSYCWFSQQFHGHQFVCSVDDVAKAMLDVYQNYDKHLKDAYLRRNFAMGYTQKQFGKNLKKFIKTAKSSKS